MDEIRRIAPEIKLKTPFVSKCSIIGNLVFLSGFYGVKQKDSGYRSNDFEEQLLYCLDTLRISLEEIGSSMHNLIKILVLINDTGDCPRFWKILMDYYGRNAPDLLKEPPAVTIIPVHSFSDASSRVGLDALAVLDQYTAGWEVIKYPSNQFSIAHTYDNFNRNLPLYAESIAVGNLLFLSGVGGENPETGNIETDDFEIQMDIGFQKILAAFMRAGSSVANIIKTLHMLANIDNLLFPSYDNGVSHSPASDRLWKRELEHYDLYAPSLLDEFPASTFLKLDSLESPGSMSAIDITGVINPEKPGWKVKNYPLYYGKRGFPHHIGEIKKYYANSVVVGNLILISGQTPTNHSTGRIETKTFEEQFSVTLENFRMALEETGSSLNNLAKTYVLLPDLSYYPVMRRMEYDYYQAYAPELVENPPASTLICPLNLASPDMLVEIDAIGFIADS